MAWRGLSAEVHQGVPAEVHPGSATVAQLPPYVHYIVQREQVLYEWYRARLKEQIPELL